MVSLYERLMEDVRFKEGLRACMNCGVCTAICPAAEFYQYDPRQICTLVQSRDEEKIEALLKSETIWYCGQCMSCKQRCPRSNIPALVIGALRSLSQELGYFVESEKGRQQYALEQTVGRSILEKGYCLYVDMVKPELHPEQGPVWAWYYENIQEVSDRLGANYKRSGAGALRIIPEENIKEVRRIFEETGGANFQENIRTHSVKKAEQMGYTMQNEETDYLEHIYSYNSGSHQK